ncbi:glycosyltransferase [Acanthopleuribacter pedis]|uniref:Erythromycin biosynthesis protein CIII-like C-terminal domain-containing protein n=1 Tax=Acanthopleuribacter pedis TaxID=442870 RepID=A0A8J7U7Q9_9BACT|nr:nucleotide disphospho-sugar-binding domain-containing protein [Acanthopleuribacter pedis]MBO1322798.1 hypothetical protein [Acanthopleuribacter pedis]
MTRYLLIVPPLTGHINPLVSVAAELEQRGHEVMWLGYRKLIEPLAGPGARIAPLESSRLRALLEPLQEMANIVRGLESVRFLFEDFVLPLARATVADVERAILEHQPDLIICDQQMLSGAIAARRLGRPWVASVTTTAAILKVWEVADRWIVRTLGRLQEEMGLPRVERPDLSNIANIVFSTPAFSGQFESYQAPFTYVGPSLQARTMRAAFPWEQLNENLPKLLVSLGTINRDRDPRFYQTVIEALADEPVQVIMTAPPGWVENPPANFIVQPHVPQVALLPYLDAVFCHGGHNTVCESLAYGLPLIVTPIRDDQPVIGRQVASSKAGITLRFNRLKPEQVRESVHRVLHEKSFRIAAKRIAASFEAAGGAPQAVDFLTALPLRRKRQTIDFLQLHSA